MSGRAPIDGRRAVEWRGAWRPRMSSGDDRCPSDERLAALAIGEISGAERETIADHVTACAKCADSYRALLDLHRSAGDSGPGPTVAGAATPRDRRRVALLAAVVLLLGALGWIVLRVGIGPSTPRPDSGPRGAVELELVPEPPQGAVLDAPPASLAWRDPRDGRTEPLEGSQRWVVEIYDDEMRPLWRSEASTGRTVDLPPAVLAGAPRPATYYWRVRSGGESDGPSALFRFRIER